MRLKLVIAKQGPLETEPRPKEAVASFCPGTLSRLGCVAVFCKNRIRIHRLPIQEEID
jgi:hypothetical protein